MGILGYTILTLCVLGVLCALILYFVAQKFKVYEDPRIDDVEKIFFRFFEKTSLRTCIGHRERIVGVDKNPGSGRCGQSFSFRVEIGGSKSDDDTA